MLRKTCCAFLALIWALPAAGAPVRAAASIGPVHSLVAAVMGETGAPALLISGGQSPHLFSLRPSTARSIAQADIVFRIAPNYEIALDAPLRETRTEIVDLIDTPGLTLYPARDLDEIEAHSDDGRAAGSNAQAAVDPHIWLDPQNARAMAREIASVLAARDPAQAQTYFANAQILDEWLAALDEAIAEDLAPVRREPFIVFHDGYQYLERRYGLRFAGAVSEMPEKLVGARHIRRLRREITAAHVRCLFTEPQFEPKLVRTVTEGLAVDVGVLDMLGAGVTPGREQYFDVMRGLSRSLRACLEKP